jgi:hypothetical protein
MVKLIINNKYVDMGSYVYELKRSHPISNGLSNVYVAYSTDMDLPLTANNVEIFDYSMLRKSGQVHKYLVGYLITSSGVMLCDVVVKRYSKKAITIYLIEKISASVKALLDGTAMLNGMPYKQFLQYDAGTITQASYTFDFDFNAYNTQEYPLPSIDRETVITRLESAFGLAINVPTDIDFLLFANRAVMVDVKNLTIVDNSFTMDSTPREYQKIQPEKMFFSPSNLYNDFEDILITNPPNDFAVYAKEGKEITLKVKGTATYTNYPPGLFLGLRVSTGQIIDVAPMQGAVDVTVIFTPVADTTWHLVCYNDEFDINNATVNVDVVITYQYTDEIGKDVPMIPEKNFLFDCFKNLPKVNVLEFLKAIALTNGYTLAFAGNVVSFKKLTDYLSIANYIDSSEHFISAEKMEFVYLKYRKNNIRYGKDTPPYATIEVNDETLEAEGDFLVIEKVLATDNDNVQLWDYSDPDSIKIREGIATVPFQAISLETYENMAQYLDEAFVYTAKFKAFNVTGQPLYIKQLNGVYLPTEIIERASGEQLKEITLQLLKL